MDDKNAQINLTSVEDVLEFVSIAEKCNFRIYINVQNKIISGKSLLGLCTVIGHGKLDVLYNGENMDFTAILDKFHFCHSDRSKKENLL